MKTKIIVELSRGMATELERYAPAKSRKRSQFVRDAIWRAISTEFDKEMIEAYRKVPQSVDEPWPFDPDTWAPEKYAIHPEPRAASRTPATRAKRPGKRKQAR